MSRSVRWMRSTLSVVALTALATLVVLALAARAEMPSPDSPRRSAEYEAYLHRPSDPESMAVVLGRRTNAPLVSRRFRGGANSAEELGQRICRALHHERIDSLMALCVSDTEFHVILWREFPQSRPATGLSWQDAWTILWPRLHAGCNHAIRDYGGHVYQFVHFDADSVAQYKNFKLYSRVDLEVKDDQGRLQQWGWVKAVVERKGSWKIYSTTD